jgi:glutamyl-tRNA reductase
MTWLTCVSVPGYRVPLSLLERLSFTRDELSGALVDLQVRTGAAQLLVLSTCERIEVYASWPGDADPASLARALAENRGVPAPVVDDAATVLTDRAAASHLLRVTAGLESFVLGETDIVGQVRMAADASRTAGASGLELERLMATAVNTSRRVHRQITFGPGARSVAAVAVQVAAARHGGRLTGQEVLVVGAGQVATEVVASAGRLGGIVTVCNRTRRHADRFTAAGAAVVNLEQLLDRLAAADVAIFGTAAPHRLVEAAQMAAARTHAARELLVIDLCVPRNMDPGVRALDGVRLLDLADLRATGAEESDELTQDVARAERIVDEEVDRYLRWLAERSAATSVQRLRADAEACAREEAARVTRGIPEEFRAVVEAGLQRAVHRLAHGPTKRLLEAAQAGDDDLVEILAGLFAAPDRVAPDERDEALKSRESPGPHLVRTR